MAVFGMLVPFHRPEPPGDRFHTRLAIDGETFDVVTDGPDLAVVQPTDTQPDAELAILRPRYRRRPPG